MTNLIRTASCLAICTIFWVGCQDSTGSDADRRVAPAATGPATTAAGEDPVYDAIQSAIADPSTLRRAARLAEILEGAGPEAVPAVRATIQKFRVDESAAEFGVLFYFWASNEPEAAADWALAAGNGRFKGAAVYTAFEAWGRIDPMAAVQGVHRANLEVADVNRLAQYGLVHGWFIKDRDALRSFIQDQEIGVERQRSVLAYVLSLISIEGADAAKAWAESLPDEDRRFKLAVFRQTSNALIRLDLPAAVEWCDRYCNTEWGRINRRSLMRARLRRGDPPQEVLAWLGTFSIDNELDAKERRDSLQVCYANWARTDRAGAVAWLESVLDSPSEPEWLPHIFAYYASIKAVADPDAALEFVKTRVKDDQESAYMAVAVRWRDEDPEAVEKWIQSAPISAETKRRIRDYKYKLPELDE